MSLEWFLLSPYRVWSGLACLPGQATHRQGRGGIDLNRYCSISRSINSNKPAAIRGIRISLNSRCQAHSMESSISNVSLVSGIRAPTLGATKLSTQVVSMAGFCSIPALDNTTCQPGPRLRHGMIQHPRHMYSRHKCLVI
jgi:hypothetical protein